MLCGGSLTYQFGCVRVRMFRNRHRMGSDSHIDNFLLTVHHYKSNRLPAFFAPAFRGTKLENRVFTKGTYTTSS